MFDTSDLASAEIADLILKNYEEAVKKYDLSWKRINGEDWVRILVKLPQLVDKCDWSEVTNRDWVDLLCEHPEFVELCKDEFLKSRMWKALTENDWSRLLKAQPQLAKYKPEQPTDAENQSGKSVVIGKWDTSHLASAEIADLILENYEEAAKNYDLSWKRINGEDWVRILVKYPQLVDKCDWSEVTNRDWVDLLCEHPEFVELCKDEFWKSGMWKALTENDWARLLKAQPQLAKYKPEQPTDTENRGGKSVVRWDTSHLASAEIADLILENYEEAAKNYDLSWKRINGEDWVRILVKYPQLVDKCDWSEVTNRDWVDLLCEHPEFVELCKDEFWKSGMWKALTENDWARLLKAQPQLAKYKLAGQV